MTSADVGAPPHLPVDVGTAPTTRTRIRRHPERGAYDRATIEAILDEALYCHVGFVVDDQPYVIPSIHARANDILYLHGSAGSRMLRELGRGVPACVTATILDGLVFARSVYNHSMNYRSVVVLGTARPVADAKERRRALTRIVEHVMPGRSADARAPSDEELTATSVLAIPLREASAKIRNGPPKDFDFDLERATWAGVVPLHLSAGEPITEQRVSDEIGIPDYITAFATRLNGMRNRAAPVAPLTIRPINSPDPEM